VPDIGFSGMLLGKRDLPDLDTTRAVRALARVGESGDRCLDQFRWPTADDAAALRGALASPVPVVARRHKYLTRRIPTLSAALDARVTLLLREDALPYEGDTERVIETIRASSKMRSRLKRLCASTHNP
jgi:hypothetical protein